MHRVEPDPRPVLTEALPCLQGQRNGSQREWVETHPLRHLFSNPWKQTWRIPHSTGLGTGSCLLLSALHLHDGLLDRGLHLSKQSSAVASVKWV